MKKEYDISNQTGLKDRILDFVHNTSENERNGNTTRADKRWIGFDRLINVLGNKVSTKDLYQVGTELIKDQDEFVINAGLTCLGTKKVIEYIYTLPSEEIEHVFDIFISFIPEADSIDQLDDRSPKIYNFIRSIENLLKFRNVSNKEEYKIKIDTILQNKLKEKHHIYLKRAIESPDLENSELKKWYEIE